ncbi:flavodoxin domain-containing protein [Oceanotoga sp. DSM 15011]|uniref:flavodoxin domain-containing protein n=1 Tax=Oceanotoga sp. DSM 15011 TaxID=2984951 RepID=UPI0021F41993|nr:flavodoxin domain-containing protein [Oceanotoga sp. DSM 15011]UYO99768.1 flavodoxin domain-containing protein [Oceanotoga sp. DSM 15011]
MKSLIVYSSKKGTGEKIANYIKDSVDTEIQIEKIKKGLEINQNGYENIILISSVYAGTMNKEFIKFSENLLLNKNSEQKIYFLVVSGFEEKFQEFVENNIRNNLDKIDMIEYAGYSYDFNKMNFFEKFIIKKVAKVNKSVENIRKDNIEKVIKKII